MRNTVFRDHFMEAGVQLGLEECVGFGQLEGESVVLSGVGSHCSEWYYTIPFLLPDAGLVSSSELRAKPGCECLGGFRPRGSWVSFLLSDTYVVGFKTLVQRDEPFSPRMKLKNKDLTGCVGAVGT